MNEPADRFEDNAAVEAGADDANHSSPPDKDACPRRNDRVGDYRVQDEMVLHDAIDDQVFALNSTARLIWEHCDGRATLAEISDALSRAFDHPVEAVFTGVQAVVADLLGRGLLTLTDDAEDTRSSEPGAASHTMRFAFEGQQVVVRTDAAAVADWITRLFRVLRTEEAGSVVGRLEVDRQGDVYSITGTRDTHVRAGTLAEAVRGLKYEIVLPFIEARPDLVWLHAGAAADEHGAVLLVGAWGCGKSTLTTALHRQGWQYLSDDVLPYDPDAGAALPFPLTPTVRPPRRHRVSPAQLAGSEKIWYDLAPDTVATTPVPIRALFFPHFDPSTSARLEPCSPGTAAVHLIKHGLNVAVLRGTAIRHLCALVNRVPAYHLPYAEGEQAADCIRQVLGR